MTPRAVAANAALVLAGSLVGLGLSEALARALWPPAPEVVVLAPGPPDPEDAIDLWGLYRETPTGRRLLPNRTVRIRNHPACECTTVVQTNSLGQRNRELGPKHGRRALFLGDSITIEEYLDERETFVRLVETLAQRSGSPLETVNAGVGAAGLADELAILEEVVVATAPDVVVLDFYLNDAMPSKAVRVPSLPRPLSASRLASTAAWALVRFEARRDPGPDGPPAEAVRRWREEVRRRFPDEPGGFLDGAARCTDDWGSAWADGAWDGMRPVFRELRRQADAHAFELVIVGFPVVGQVGEEPSPAIDYPQARLTEVGRTLGVRVLDLLPVLRQASRSHPNVRLFVDHCHPTAAGSRVIAQAITEFLTAPTQSGQSR